MFFYLLSNSTLIEEENENTKNIKILVYGAIGYIVLHATLFIGGEDCLFASLKPYFWMLLLLDIAVVYLVFTQKNSGSITDVMKTRDDTKDYLLNISESNIEPIINDILKEKKPKKKRKKVSFNEQLEVSGPPMGSNSLDNSYFSNTDYTNNIGSSDSDSDSDLSTDVDLNEFEKSISL